MLKDGGIETVCPKIYIKKYFKQFSNLAHKDLIQFKTIYEF